MKFYPAYELCTGQVRCSGGWYPLMQCGAWVDA